MKENLKIIVKINMENILTVIKIYMKVNSIKEKFMEKENIFM